MRLPIAALILSTALPSAALAQADAWRPDLLAMYESEGGKNVPNFKYDGPDGEHSAEGVCQMLKHTWQRIAPMIDIDTNKFVTAGTASEFDQWRACYKLWSLDGYQPWTCRGCNAKLRQVLHDPRAGTPPHPQAAEQSPRLSSRPPEDPFIEPVPTADVIVFNIHRR